MKKNILIVLLCLFLPHCAFASSPAVSPAGSPVYSEAVAVAETPCEYTPDWPNYDGSTNGTLVEDFIQTGQWNTGEYAQYDENTSLTVFTTTPDGSANSYSLESGIVTSNPCNLTLSYSSGSTLASGGSLGQPDLVQFSSTRYLVASNNNNTDSFDFYLIDETGATVDSISYTSGTIADNFKHDLTAHDEDTAVLGFRGNGTDTLILLAIDAASDTLSYGSALNTAVSTTGLPGLASLTSTAGVVTTSYKPYRYTVSGTALTIDYEATYGFDPGATTNQNAYARKIDTGKALLVYKLGSGGSANKYQMILATDTGSALNTSSKVTINTVTVGHDRANELEIVYDYDGSTAYALLAYPGNTSTNCQTSLLSYNGTSLSVVDNETTVATSDVGCEHPTVHTFLNGSALLHYQDDVYWDWIALSGPQ